MEIERFRQLQQQLEEVRKSVKKILTKEASERLSRVRLVKPELASQVELYLFALLQEGRISKLITEEELKKILQSVSQQKEFRIKYGKA